jgi:hypothetical protein
VALLTLALAGVLGFAEDRPQNIAGKGDIASPPNPIETIEGTTWAGTDSDGDWYEYTFLKGGQLRYSTNTQRTRVETFEMKENVWAQNGKLVVILIQNYSVNVGTIEGNQMTGNAWNFAGRRWTWEAKRK